MYKRVDAMNPLKNLTISHLLLKRITELDEFKGRWEALGRLAPDRLSVLRRVATIESIGSSTRIEGVKLTDSEIEHLLSGLDIQSFRSRDEEEVAGYAKLMESIFESFHDIRLSENHIKQLHKILLDYSTKDLRHRGEYKKLANHVEAFDSHGKSIGIIFETATPFDTPQKMHDLIAWTCAEVNKAETHILLIIAIFIIRFLAIHPFQDGNGRLSRALTTLLLLQAGYHYVPYSSLERIIEENKEDYYKTLRRGQSTLDQSEEYLNDWISFFIECLVQQKNILENKIEREKLMAPLSPLSEKIVAFVAQHGKIRVQDAVAIIGANRNTIKDHLKQLVQSGYLIKRGQGRGTWYERNISR